MNSKYQNEQIEGDYNQQIGYIYYIYARELNRVKIGFTVRSIKERMGEFQTGSPTPLSLLGYSVLQNPFFIEQKLHFMFEPFRVRVDGQQIGEWFHAEGIVLNFIWLYANRLVATKYFPEEIQLNPLKLELYNPIMATKGKLFYTDYLKVLDEGRIRRIKQTDQLKYDKMREKENAGS